MNKFNTLLAILIGTIILSLVGFYNGYPLVYSDTGTYIYSGFNKFIPKDRPIIYGLLLKQFSFSFSAWFVILFQNAITAFVLFKTLQIFDFRKNYLTKIYFSILMFLVLFTGIGWYSNQLMPDFFSPLIILIVFILHKRRQLFDLSGILLLLILIISLITHFSHILLGCALMTIIIANRLFLKLLNDIPFKRILIIAGFVFSSWLILPSINYIFEKQFVLSKGSHVFLMAHLNDAGVLSKFLNENCSDPEFMDCKLCQYKDSLPIDLASFIWSSDILEKSGGWIESENEYNKIIRATLTRPQYLFLNIYRSLTYGFIQLTKNEIGQGLSAYNEGSAPYGQIHWRFHDELNNYLNSRQNKWNGVGLKLDSVNTIHLSLLIISIFILILLFGSSVFSKIDAKTKLFLQFVIISILLNSFITAGLNSPCSRFQARVVWLLPLSIILIGLKNYNLLYDTFSHKLNEDLKR